MQARSLPADSLGRQGQCPVGPWPALRPVPRASEMEHLQSGWVCASSAIGPLCWGPGLALLGPSIPYHCSQGAGASLCSCRVPGLCHPSVALPHTPPPEPHLRRCHGNGEHQALAAKGAPERGPWLRLGRRWGCSRHRQANLLFPGLLPAPDQPWAGVGATNRMGSQSQVGRGRQASGHWD